MKLVIDCLVFQKNKALGYQEYLFNLLDYFHMHRTSILANKVFVVCDHSQVGEFAKYIDQFDIRPLKAFGKLDQILSQNRLRRKLGLSSRDVILHTYNYGPFIRQGRSLLVVHDLLYKHGKLLNSAVIRLHRKLSMPVSLRQADHIIAISAFTKTDILSTFNVPSKKIDVIYNFLNLKKFDGPIPENLTNFPVNLPFFLSVSSILRHKNIILLLRAFRSYLAGGGEGRLILVGLMEKMDDECRSYYQKLPTNIQERITFTGYISNQLLKYLYEHCLSFILPTRFEGLGMPIVEAMYFNSPCFLSDIPICREVSDGMAEYFGPDDERTLTNLMLSAKSARRRPTRDLVAQKFSAANTSDRYIQLINSLQNQ